MEVKKQEACSECSTGRAQSEVEGLPQESQRPLRLGVMLSTKGDHRTVGMWEIQGLWELPHCRS